jgi:hypothetical protein
VLIFEIEPFNLKIGKQEHWKNQLLFIETK